MRKLPAIGDRVVVNNEPFSVDAVKPPAPFGAVNVPSTGVVFVYQSDDGGWRWNLRRKGRILADSGESYAAKAKAQRAVAAVFAGLYPVVTLGQFQGVTAGLRAF